MVTFFMLLNILIIIYVNFISDKLLVSIFCGSYSGEFSCSFILGLSSPFGYLFVFVSKYWGDLLRLWFKPMSDAACDWPWATCLELTACGSLCWVWVCTERTRMHTKASFYQH